MRVSRSAFIVLLLCAAAVHATEYEIKLVRPLPVGQKYSFVVDGATTQHATIRFGDQVQTKEDGFGVRLEGTAEILEINRDGEESKVACTLTKAVRITPKGETELIPAGRTVTASPGKEKTTFTIDQGKLSDEAIEALELCINMGDEDGFNDDHIYGTTKPQPIGSTWDFNAKAASDEAKLKGVNFDPKDASGKMTLTSLDSVDGIECLRIDGELDIKQVTAKAPPGMKFEAGSMKGRYGGQFPLDLTKGSVSESLSATYTAVFRGENNISVDSKMQRAAEMKRTFMPAPATKPATTRAADGEAYEFRKGSPDGIGKWYMGREIAQVMGHQGASWLERAEREDEERPSRLIEILKTRIKPTDVFADIGAGTGYYSFRLAAMLPEGKVLAVDIQQEMLDLMSEKAKEKGVKNVEPILGTIDDPKLPENSVDYVLLVDAYHEFDHPREMMSGILKGLRPGGKVLLLEFRGEDKNVPIKLLHKMTEAQAKKEWEASGFKHVETLRQLPWQHVIVFEKPATQPAKP